MTHKLIESLSLRRQKYLEVIAICCERKGFARNSEIASRLNIKRASVTETLNYLEREGLILRNQNRTVKLSAKGKEIVSQLDTKHEVLFRFFKDIVGMDDIEADRVACEMEHKVDSYVVDRIACVVEFIQGSYIDFKDKFLRYIEKCKIEKKYQR